MLLLSLPPYNRQKVLVSDLAADRPAGRIPKATLQRIGSAAHHRCVGLPGRPAQGKLAAAPRNGSFFLSIECEENKYAEDAESAEEEELAPEQSSERNYSASRCSNLVNWLLEPSARSRARSLANSRAPG